MFFDLIDFLNVLNTCLFISKKLGRGQQKTGKDVECLKYDDDVSPISLFANHCILLFFMFSTASTFLESWKIFTLTTPKYVICHIFCVRSDFFFFK